MKKLKHVYLYETEFDVDAKHKYQGRVDHHIESEFKVIRDAYHDAGYRPFPQFRTYAPLVSNNLTTRPIEWGQLNGNESCEVLQDDTRLRVKLPEPTGYGPPNYRRGWDVVSVTNPVNGDFDIQVKVIPDWKKGDHISASHVDRIGGGFYLAAGLLVKQSPEHYLRWSWNLGYDRSQGPYSIITPVYVSYNDPQTAIAGSCLLYTSPSPRD